MKSEYLTSNENNSLSMTLPSTSSRSPKSHKLQAFFSRKLASQHLQIMTNRVNQLEKIKFKTQKEVEKLKQDIVKEQERINAKNQYQEKKRRFSQDNQESIEQRRIYNKKLRDERKKKIKDFTESLLKEKQRWVKEKKEKTNKWQEEIVENRFKDLDKKSIKYRKLKTGYVRSLRERCTTQRLYEESIKSRYSQSIAEEKRMEGEAYEKINSLEEAENVLIDDLSRTIEVRKALRQNLNRLRNLSI